MARERRVGKCRVPDTDAILHRMMFYPGLLGRRKACAFGVVQLVRLGRLMGFYLPRLSPPVAYWPFCHFAVLGPYEEKLVDGS